MAEDPETLRGLAALGALEEQRKASEAEERLAQERARMSIPAVYIDKFYMNYWKGHVRLTLGERSANISSGIHWRFAALLEKDDVKTLARRLKKILKDLEDEEAEEEASTEVDED